MVKYILKITSGCKVEASQGFITNIRLLKGVHVISVLVKKKTYQLKHKLVNRKRYKSFTNTKPICITETSG